MHPDQTAFTSDIRPLGVLGAIKDGFDSANNLCSRRFQGVPEISNGLGALFWRQPAKPRLGIGFAAFCTMGRLLGQLIRRCTTEAQAIRKLPQRSQTTHTGLRCIQAAFAINRHLAIKRMEPLMRKAPGTFQARHVHHEPPRLKVRERCATSSSTTGAKGDCQLAAQRHILGPQIHGLRQVGKAVEGHIDDLLPLLLWKPLAVLNRTESKSLQQLVCGHIPALAPVLAEALHAGKMRHMQLLVQLRLALALSHLGIGRSLRLLDE